MSEAAPAHECRGPVVCRRCGAAYLGVSVDTIDDVVRADAAEALSDRLETAARAYIEGHELAMTRAEAAEEALAAAQLEVGVLKTALMDFQDAADQHGFKCEPYLEPDQHGSWLGVFNADNCPMCMGRAAPDGHGHGFPAW